MKIGILGSGIVGQVLGNGFLLDGHQVMLGSRTPGKEEVLKCKNKNTGGLTGTFQETALFGELIVLAISGKNAIKAIELAGKNNFPGKIIIDTTNPIADEPPVNGQLKFFTDLDHSLMEKLQEELPSAKFVKAFNSVGSGLMYKPDLDGQQPTMFICGNDAGAKTMVTNMLNSFGWDAEDMGPVEAARVLEPLCILWCIPGFLRNEWGHAFKLLKKKAL